MGKLTTALSERQEQIVQLIEAGYSARQIADKLGVSRTTVRDHIRAIRLKRATEILRQETGP